MWKQQISHREMLAVFAVFVPLAFLISVYLVVEAPNHMADTANFFDYVINTAKSGFPNAPLGLSILDALHTWGEDFRSVCSNPLVPSVLPPWNVLTFHAYLIDYPLAGLTFFMPVEVAIPVAHGLAFLSLLLITYFILRGFRVSIVGSICFVSLVAAHPIWSMGLPANYYPDRFFLPFALIYMWQLHIMITGSLSWTRRQRLVLVAMGIMAAIATERAAITLGVVTLICLILYWPQIGTLRRRLEIAGYGITPLLAFAIYRKFQVNLYMEVLPLTPSSLWKAALVSVQSAHTWKFVTVNIGLFGIFALANWRLALVAGAAMGPNLLISIGGAEKTAFYSHYHDIYFPFLVYATAYGYVRVLGWLKSWQSHGAVYAAVVSATAILIFIDAYTPAIRFDPSRFDDRIVPKLWTFYWHRHFLEPSPQLKLLRDVEKEVPEGVTVTTVEGFMPILRPNRTLHYYPIDIDSADYAVIVIDKDRDGKSYFSGAVSYQNQSEELNKCLTERLREAGYNVDNPKIIGHAAILRRNPAVRSQQPAPSSGR